MIFLDFCKKSTFRVISPLIVFITFSGSAFASPKDGTNTYHAAKAYTIDGKSYDHVNILINEKSELNIRGCGECKQDSYKYLENVSNIIGKNVYQLSDTDYIIEEENGLLFWAKFPKGLGKKTWSRLDPYNVLAKDRMYVRQLYTNAEMQNAVKKAIIKYSRSVKKEFAKSKAENSVTMR